MNVTFFGKRVFTGIIKDLKIRKSWIYVNLKPNDWCPYKREAEEIWEIQRCKKIKSEEEIGIYAA